MTRDYKLTTTSFEKSAHLPAGAQSQRSFPHRYGLSIAEALIAPAMPSTTARAGGIFMPIMNSLSLASDSKPGELWRVLAYTSAAAVALLDPKFVFIPLMNSLSLSCDSKPGESLLFVQALLC